MKFGIGAVMAVVLATSADSFQVKPTVVQRQIQAANELVTRPMAAGGAERAYGDDYYDGMSKDHTKSFKVLQLEAQTFLAHNCLSTGVRIGPPPDLPSLLLHNRIVYIGMPLVPAVTELVIAELLYLNYESTTDPITMYINSSGTTTADGQQVGFETEAFAIADVMKVRCGLRRKRTSHETDCVTVCATPRPHRGPRSSIRGRSHVVVTRETRTTIRSAKCYHLVEPTTIDGPWTGVRHCH